MGIIYGFEYSCEGGQLDVLTYLSSISRGCGRDRRSNDAFIISCKHGHLEMAKWIYSNNTVDSDTHNKALAYCSGNELVDWLIG